MEGVVNRNFYSLDGQGLSYCTGDCAIAAWGHPALKCNTYFITDVHDFFDKEFKLKFNTLLKTGVTLANK
jgi:hypothetical protein